MSENPANIINLKQQRKSADLESLKVVLNLQEYAVIWKIFSNVGGYHRLCGALQSIMWEAITNNLESYHQSSAIGYLDKFGGFHQ